jgi:PKD repeat protein
MVVYTYPQSLLKPTGNILQLVNAQINFHGNAGVVEIRDYLFTGTASDYTLTDPCTIANLVYGGPDGSNFEFNFNYETCEGGDPLHEPNSCVFQVCNANKIIDDNFEVYLNDIYIGFVDLNKNDFCGSLFVGIPGSCNALIRDCGYYLLKSKVNYPDSEPSLLKNDCICVYGDEYYINYYYTGSGPYALSQFEKVGLYDTQEECDEAKTTCSVACTGKITNCGYHLLKSNVDSPKLSPTLLRNDCICVYGDDYFVNFYYTGDNEYAQSQFTETGLYETQEECDAALAECNSCSSLIIDCGYRLLRAFDNATNCQCVRGDDFYIDYYFTGSGPYVVTQYEQIGNYLTSEECETALQESCPTPSPTPTPSPVPTPSPAPTPAPTPNPVPTPIIPVTPIVPVIPIFPLTPVAPTSPDSLILPSLTYPTALDTDVNLYGVKDSLRLTLAQDYMAGDTVVVVENNPSVMTLFPATGIITLTENCSDPEFRAISLYYPSRTDTTFDEVKLLEGFVDCDKPKNVTNVTMNVVAQHHNAIKNALKLIQGFAGIAGETTGRPLFGTMEQRTNYLRRIAYNPKPWFTANATIGIVPFTVDFTDLSFNSGKDLENNDITYTWDFGDGTVKVISYSIINSTGDISHTYQNPGIYTITLTVANIFGSSTSVLADYINARYIAPEFATMSPELNAYQVIVNNQVKTPNNMNLYISITDNGGYSIDPVVNYEWILSDVLAHPNNSNTNVNYAIGGIYDIVVKCITENESYRITQKANYVNVVESKNYYLFTYGNNTNFIYANEMGLLSETFKATQQAGIEIFVNDDFLVGTNNSTQAIREFSRNIFSTLNGYYSSGIGGNLTLSYASGRNQTDSSSLEKINSFNFNAFNETYNSYNSTDRPWNWIAFAIENSQYFLFGNPLNQTAGLSLTNQQITEHNFTTNVYSSTSITSNQYLGASADLKQNPAQFDDDQNLYGYFSVYRTALNGRNGYILRNSGVGDFFQLKSFYRTKENGADFIYYFEKLNDIAGGEKSEGQIVNLSSGVYFFNNSGSVSAYKPDTGTWEVGGPGLNSLTYREFQDTTNPDYDNPENTLIACSDNDHAAYLSFDYSNNSFSKFDDITLTFSKLPERINNSQWNCNIF